MQKSVPGLLTALLAGALWCPIGVHAETDALVREALAMAQSGKARQAYALLEPQETARAGDPDFDTVFGIAANEIGEYSRAIFALERVLAVQPANARARAELGRALFAVGDNKAARTVLEQTKDQGIPLKASQSIDQFLQAIDRVEADGRSSWRGHVETSIGRDSNVNSGPSDPNVAVPAFGAVFQLNAAGVKTAATFATLGAGVQGRYVLDPRWSLIGNAAASYRSNSGSADVFNTRQIALNGGASYRYERHEFSLVGQFDTQNVDGARARDQAGVVGEWMMRFDAFRQAGAYVQLSRLSYPLQAVRDADRRVLGASYAHQMRSGLLAYGGAYAGEEAERNRGVPHLGHTLQGLRLGVQQPLGTALAGFATLGYEQRRHGGADPLFQVTRRDRQTNVNLGLNWVPVPEWRVTPQLALMDTRSNIVIADYDRTTVSVTVRRDF